MPKSKRDRQITLSQTRKKPALEFKQSLVEKIRSEVEEKSLCFVFQVENSRNVHLKDLREHWHGKAAFFLGKNRVMALALGRTEAEEVADGLSGLTRLLRNQCGLMFTNEPKDEVIEYFNGHSRQDYARAGCKASETVTLEEGPLEQFPHNMEPQLRQLGLPTTLKKGVVNLLGEYTVCSKGDVLTADQARLLKLLGHQQAKFRYDASAIPEKKALFNGVNLCFFRILEFCCCTYVLLQLVGAVLHVHFKNITVKIVMHI